MVNRMNKGHLGYMGVNSNLESKRPLRNPMENQNRQSNGQNGNALLGELQKVDFAIVETVLYLDAYPNCTKALDYYKRLTQKRETICDSLKAAGIPLNIMSNTAGTWTWTDSPWPWELEANL